MCSSFLPSGKQSQILLQPTEVELGLQVGVEFDNCAVVNQCEILGRSKLYTYISHNFFPFVDFALVSSIVMMEVNLELASSLFLIGI